MQFQPLPLDPRDHERSSRPFNRLARIPDGLRHELEPAKPRRRKRRKVRRRARAFIK